MHQSSRRKFGLTAITGTAIAALLLTGCVQSERGESSGEGGGSDVDTTFVFAATADPKSLDPAFAQDGESFRIARQIFEGLVTVKPGTADPAPFLAESWEGSEDGMSYDFTLKEGVKFHDGTDFNAEAVCFNFDRWYNWTDMAASPTFAYYYGKLYHATVEDAANAVYKSCTVNGDHEVTIELNKPFAGFISSLSLPAFRMQSPTALQEYGADDVGGTADSPSLSEYMTAHPTGTGPFKFEEWAPGESVTLSAFEDYWGEQGQIETVIFRVIPDATARLQALESGSIDGYDNASPSDTEALEAKGFKMQPREPFTILYLAFNQAIPELQDIKVREAISHAIDKEALAAQVLPEGTQTATQFMPPSVAGYNDDVTVFEYDVDKARELLAEAGYTEENPLKLDFNYPVNVSRPYMPSPEQIFTVLANQLEEVGSIEITPVTSEWVEYLNLTSSTQNHGIHLLGWTGDYNDTDNFTGVFFGQKSDEWGFDNESIFSKLTEARGIPNIEDQTALYEEINAEIADFIPGVPLAHPAPTIALSPRVESYPSSPVGDEPFNRIVLSE